MAKNDDTATVDALKTELEALREEFTSLLSRLSDDAHGVADEAKSELRARLRGMSAEARHAAERAREKGEEYVVDAQDLIARNPLTAVGAAAAVGFMIGLYTRRH